VSIAKLRFLIVQDHGFQRWAVGELLQGLGARYILTASDGHDALEIFRSVSEPIDIILSDLDMPGMDGMEFIRHVGEAGKPVSLILLSRLDRSLVASVEMMTRAYGVHLLAALDNPATARKLEAAIRLHDANRPAASVAGEPRASFSVAEIADGLEEGQFEPYFQPKVDLESERLVGAEALARWRHPTHGIIAAGAFIGTLEKAGWIEALTQVMLEKAALACRSWQNAGIDATVSINLSVESLAHVNLVDRMTQVVDRRALAPASVIFEITESAATHEVGRTIENLARLRVKGFGLSLDDYGTGYSSMQQLTRIPFTELKIDQSFVINAAQPASRAMLESSLELAGKLGITAVAEGVETKVEWDLVRGMGCRLGQGYFIGHPMEGGEFIDWARMHNR
jgi:EAL domain-containing protein (putative c-di-GMP-specific phosphodiesterase class I)/CheY-like chemotaxis protein